MRSLLGGTLLACVALWAGPLVYDWYRSISLWHAVAEFNATSAFGLPGPRQQPLTHQEVVEAIKRELVIWSTPENEKPVLRQVLRTHRLPSGSRLIEGYFVGDRGSQMTIDLEIAAKDGSFQTVPVRKPTPSELGLGEWSNPTQNYDTTLMAR